MKFKECNIVELAQSAERAACQLRELTSVQFNIIPHLPRGSWHPILVPTPQGPAEREAAGPYDSQTKSRRVIKMVTEVDIDYSHASLWLCTDRNRTEPITFRIEGSQIRAHIPGIWYARDSDYQIGTFSRRFFESKGVVMDLCIHHQDQWFEITDVDWENIDWGRGYPIV